MGLTQVSTDGVKNDAITKTKIPANQIEASELADNAVNTNAIADQAVALSKLPHGDSNNDGKFLRANNGADPSFETISIPAGTTINNNAGDRLVTAENSANTLNGEANATFNGQKLTIGPVDGGSDVILSVRNTASGGYGAYIQGGAGTNYILRLDDKDQNNMFRFNANGNFGLNTGSPVARLHVNTSHYVPTSSGTSTTGIHLDGNPGNAGEYGGGISFGCGNASGSAAAIAARQGSSDSDVIGLSFFTHNSGAGSADAVEKVRIHDDGVTSFNDGICLGNGLTLSSVNTMNDYEIGNWTPQIQGTTGAGTANYNTQTGKYIKIGNLVYLTAELNWSQGSAGGELRITNLPFSPTTDCEGIGNAMFKNVAIGGDTANISAYVGPNTNYMYFYQSRQGEQTWNTLSYDDAGGIIINVTFRVA